MFQDNHLQIGDKSQFPTEIRKSSVPIRPHHAQNSLRHAMTTSLLLITNTKIKMLEANIREQTVVVVQTFNTTHHIKRQTSRETQDKKFKQNLQRQQIHSQI